MIFYPFFFFFLLHLQIFHRGLGFFSLRENYKLVVCSNSIHLCVRGHVFFFSNQKSKLSTIQQNSHTQLKIFTSVKLSFISNNARTIQTNQNPKKTHNTNY